MILRIRAFPQDEKTAFAGAQPELGRVSRRQVTAGDQLTPRQTPADRRPFPRKNRGEAAVADPFNACRDRSRIPERPDGTLRSGGNRLRRRRGKPRRTVPSATRSPAASARAACSQASFPRRFMPADPPRRSIPQGNRAAYSSVPAQSGNGSPSGGALRAYRTLQTR